VLLIRAILTINSRQLRLFALLVFLICHLSVNAETVVFGQAQAEMTVDGKISHQSVALPYLWEREQGRYSGQSKFDISFIFDPLPETAYSLSIPRMANGYKVVLNGVVIDKFGDLNRHGHKDAKLPRLIKVPIGLLRQENLLSIHLRSDIGRQSGLSLITLGPEDEISSLYREVLQWRTLGRAVVVVFSALVALIGFVLWLTQIVVNKEGTHQRDRVYLYGFIAEFLWTFRVADSLIEAPPLDVAWWSVVSSLALGAWGCLTMLFCMEVLDWRKKTGMMKVRSWMLVLMLFGFIAAPAGWIYGRPIILTFWYAVLGLTFLMLALMMLRLAISNGASINSRLLSFAVFFNVLVGLSDLYRLRVSPSTDGSTGLYYSSMLFGLTAGYIVLMRFRAISDQARHLVQNLEKIVFERETELHTSYQKLEQLARQHERTTERTRILRDMHDGVGANISTAIRQLEFGLATRAEVLITLRESMDQLKLSIDAMNLPLGDLTSLLANLRYRLEPRLKAAGVELSWGVEQLPLMTWLDALAMRHVQFMVYEAISNALQHAGATVMRIELKPTQEGGAQLRVMDNGCGFDLSQVKQQGLSSLRERAKSLNALLQVISEPGQTVIQLTWSNYSALKSAPSSS